MSEHVERLRRGVNHISDEWTADDLRALLADYDTAVRERDEARRLLAETRAAFATAADLSVTTVFDRESISSLLRLAEVEPHYVRSHAEPVLQAFACAWTRGHG